MAIIRCDRGHYYDSAKYEDCPTCRSLDQRTSELMRELHTGFPDSQSPVNEDVTMPLIPRGGETIEIGGGRRHVSGGAADEDEVTVALFSKSGGTAFVTGWIVCVDGPLKGRDYRIHHGMNRIGLSMNSDICLNGASGINMNKHCSVVYDDKSNRFYVVPENGMIYLKGETVTEPKVLSTGDMIQIGNCSFEFIPFCREGHVWKGKEDSENGRRMTGEWLVTEED